MMIGNAGRKKIYLPLPAGSAAARG